MNSIIQKLKIPHEVLNDFDSNRLILIVLCIGFLPMALKGYSMYLLALLVPLLFKTQYGFNSLMVIFFSFFYTLSVLYRGEPITSSNLIFMLAYPLIIYQAGEYIGQRVKSLRTISLLMIAIAIVMATPAIFDNVLDYLRSGELVNAKRAVEAASGQESGATRYGVMLALCLGLSGISVLSTNNRYDFLIKASVLGFVLLAMLSTIHLVNRSGLVIAAISVAGAAVLPPFTRKRVFYALLIFAACYLIYIIYLEMTPLLKKAIESYQYRDSTQGSVKSLGGRDDLWRQGIQHLYDFPMGGGKSVTFHGRASYAHNMWIDCGIVGGVVSMGFLLVMTFKYVISCFKLLFHQTINTYDRNILLLLAATFMIQSMVEPIIESLPQFFWAWILFWAIITSYLRKQRDLSEQPATL